MLSIFVSGASRGFDRGFAFKAGDVVHTEVIGNNTKPELDFLSILYALHWLEEHPEHSEVNFVCSAPYLETFLRRSKDGRKADCQKIALKARRLFKRLLWKDYKLSFSLVVPEENPAYALALEAALNRNRPMLVNRKVKGS